MTKHVQLASADDNAEIGLAKDEEYYPVTDIAGVKDLGPATTTTDGLMSKDDKQKLDNLKVEPISSLQIVDSITGSVYLLTVENGEIKIKEANK